MSTFAQYNFPDFLNQALTVIHFTTPTDAQEALLPPILAGKDVVGQAETGSGKTHAFLLPILAGIQTAEHTVQAVITAPSRELAEQLKDAAEQLVSRQEPQTRILLAVGGTDKERLVEKIEHRQPQLVIGTPGRLADLVTSHVLQVQTTRYFVVDEADMSLDMGFLTDVDHIASAMPTKLQMLVFSATIPEKLQPFLRKYMHSPEMVRVALKSVISPTIKNILLATKGRDHNRIINTLLHIGQPFLVLVFANTKERVDELYDYLQKQGLKVAKIHGDIPPRERRRTMKEVRDLQYQYVVATDLAARGIDVPGVSLVINDDFPKDPEFFIHRVGRTGRNGLAGTAISLYDPEQEQQVAQIEGLGISFVPEELKDGELVAANDRNRRRDRQGVAQAIDPSIKGMVAKEKKKRMPGYKNKIRKAIKVDARRKRKIARREQRRK